MRLSETRVRRSIAEKRRIAELTFEPGASLALVARAHGVNANQAFTWRRELKRGELAEPDAAATALVPVMLSSPRGPNHERPQASAKEQPAPGGSIHIEFPGRAVIAVEHGADRAVLQAILATLASADCLL
jgi:transposase